MPVSQLNPDDTESAQDPEVMATSLRTDVASAAVATSSNSSAFESSGFGSGSFTVNVTAVSGTTPKLVLILQQSDDGSNWDNSSSTVAITATGLYYLVPNLPRRKYRFNYTVTGTTPSFTFSIVTTLKPYIYPLDDLGYSYINITGNATTVVKQSPGVLGQLIINNNTTGGTITIYDNTAGSGTKISTMQVGSPSGGLLTSTGLPGPIAMAPLSIGFKTGLTVVTAGSANNDITVIYK